MSHDRISDHAPLYGCTLGLLFLLALFSPILYFGWVIWHTGTI